MAGRVFLHDRRWSNERRLDPGRIRRQPENERAEALRVRGTRLQRQDCRREGPTLRPVQPGLDDRARVRSAGKFSVRCAAWTAAFHGTGNW